MTLRGNPNLGQRAQVIKIVRDLCEKLSRPVCSIDFRAFLSDNPDCQYSYVQAAGQTLFKASIRCASPRNSPIVQVGLCNYRAYYAPDDDPRWFAAFERFKALQIFDFLIREHFLCHLSCSDATPLTLYSRQILAARLIELLPFIRSHPSVATADSWLSCYIFPQPTAFSFVSISRSQARNYLKSEMESRAPYLQSDNINRHLAAMSPTILREPSPALFSAGLVSTYSAVHWPDKNESSVKLNSRLASWILANTHSVNERGV